MIIYYLMQKVLAGITHGDNGLWFLTQIDSTPILDLTRPAHFFVFALVVCFAVWALYKYLDDSIYGACCLAAKINEDKLIFLGYGNFSIRLAAFVIAPPFGEKTLVPGQRPGQSLPTAIRKLKSEFLELQHAEMCPVIQRREAT